MTERATFRIACYMVIEKGNKILLQRRCGGNYCNGYYSVPAGHLEKNEKCMDCVIREFKEETNLDVEKKDVKLIFVLGATEDSEYMCLFFSADSYNGEMKIMEPDKCDDLRFFDLDDLPDNMVPELKIFLKLRKSGSIYSEEKLHK